MFTWAVCGHMSSCLLHVGRLLSRCAAEPLRLITEDDHLGTFLLDFHNKFFGQVYEMLVMKSSPPRNLTVVEQVLTFSSPEYDGGSRIQNYEVSTILPPSNWCKDLNFKLIQIHICKEGCSDWFLWKKVPVKYLSPEPELEESLLGGLCGSFSVRVFGVNLAGLGEFCETFIQISGANYS